MDSANGEFTDDIEFFLPAQVAEVADCPEMYVRSVVPEMGQVFRHRHFTEEHDLETG